jgi:hypothetical protein
MQINKKYLAFGIIIGCAVGVATKNIGVWLPVGVAMGIALGRIKNKQ